MSGELLTPPGPGGVAVIRLSPSEAERALERLEVHGLPAPGTLRLVRLRDGLEDLDEALLVHLQDVVELHLHGSPPLVERLLALLESAGAACVSEAVRAALRCSASSASCLARSVSRVCIRFFTCVRW